MLLEGVAHVMGLFAKHFFEGFAAVETSEDPVQMPAEGAAYTEQMEELIELLCDEEGIDNT